MFIRYIDLVLSPPDWTEVAPKFHSLAKPGGYIHWTYSVARSSFSIAPRFLPFVRHLACAARELEAIPVAVGFEEITHGISSTDREPEDRAAGPRI